MRSSLDPVESGQANPAGTERADQADQASGPVSLRECRARHLSIPLRKQRISGIHSFTHLETILLELDAGDAVGIGYAFTFEPWQARSILAMVVDLAGELLRQPAAGIDEAWDRLWRRINYIGQAGPPVMALSAVDTALWDLRGQRAGVPLHSLLGANRGTVPAYVSGGWLSYSKEELVEEASWSRDHGFEYYKMKVGSPDWRRDVDRVAQVIETLDGSVQVMVDANQAWDAATAIAAGRALEELGVYWLEEPVDVNDVEGSAEVAAALDLRIASGESVFTRFGFRPLIELRGADVLMPDVMRCGGPSEFMQVARMAEAAAVPVSSHLFTEVSAHLIAATPAGTLVEYIPGWFDDLFEGAPPLVGGSLALPAAPGLGFTFSEQPIRDYSAGEPVVLRKES